MVGAGACSSWRRRLQQAWAPWRMMRWRLQMAAMAMMAKGRAGTQPSCSGACCSMLAMCASS